MNVGVSSYSRNRPDWPAKFQIRRYIKYKYLQILLSTTGHQKEAQKIVFIQNTEG